MQTSQYLAIVSKMLKVKVLIVLLLIGFVLADVQKPVDPPNEESPSASDKVSCVRRPKGGYGISDTNYNFFCKTYC